MAYYNQHAETRVTTDASPVGLGAKSNPMVSSVLCIMPVASSLRQNNVICNFKGKLLP